MARLASTPAAGQSTECPRSESVQWLPAHGRWLTGNECFVCTAVPANEQLARLRRYSSWCLAGLCGGRSPERQTCAVMLGCVLPLCVYWVVCFGCASCFALVDWWLCVAAPCVSKRAGEGTTDTALLLKSHCAHAGTRRVAVPISSGHGGCVVRSAACVPFVGLGPRRGLA